MATKFSDLIHEIEEEAAAEGEEATADLHALRARFQLARELMAIRKERHLTQMQLAQISGIGQSEISNIETGNANPTVATVATLGSALGVELHLVPSAEGVPGGAFAT